MAQILFDWNIPLPLKNTNFIAPIRVWLFDGCLTGKLIKVIIR